MRPVSLITVMAIALSGCRSFHAYEGDVAYRDVTLHFRSDQEIERLWALCGGDSGIQAFAIRSDDGSCNIWMPPPDGENDSHFGKLLYHELGHCEDPAFGETQDVAPNCALDE